MSPQTTARPATARRRVWPHRLVALTLVLAGGAVTGWPVAETFAHNTEGAADVSAYVAAVAAARAAEDAAGVAASDPGNPAGPAQPAGAARPASTVSLPKELDRARAYNAALSPAALRDPWGDETPSRSAAHDAYLAQLAAFDALGRVRIPQINVDLPIYHDATKQPLSRGVGHMYGTSLPVGGPDTHAVLAAHTGSSRRTFFDRLPEVTLGQTFHLDVYGATLTYRVDRITVVEPWELDAVERVPGADHVTLVTCYTPPGEHNQRLLVRGVRVPGAAAPAGTADAAGTTTQAAPAASEKGAAPAASESRTDAAALVPVAADTSVQGWMVPRLAGTGGAAALAVLMSVTWVVGDRRTRRDAAATLPAPADPTHPGAPRREPVEATR